MNEKLKKYYEKYDHAFQTNDITELAYLNKFANEPDIRKWNREQVVIAMAEKDGVDVSIEKNLFFYHRSKGNHPDLVLLFRNDDTYCAYLDDADVLNKVMGYPLLNWNETKSAGFPKAALDYVLPRLIRAGYRIGIYGDESKVRNIAKPIKLEPPKPARKEPIQLSLF